MQTTEWMKLERQTHDLPRKTLKGDSQAPHSQQQATAERPRIV
jgi:hypothetical protein